MNTLPWERIARANTHPLKISILEVLSIDGGRVMSPTDLKTELQERLANVDYHIGKLYDQGLVGLVREVPIRGVTEHFYRLAYSEGDRG